MYYMKMLNKFISFLMKKKYIIKKTIISGKDNISISNGVTKITGFKHFCDVKKFIDDYLIKNK